MYENAETLQVIIVNGERVNRFAGEILKAIGYEDKTAGQKFRELNYELHVGNALGLTGKILVFIVSLIAASLPLTGFLIWSNLLRQALIAVVGAAVNYFSLNSRGFKPREFRVK